jgi:hypothetical protein
MLGLALGLLMKRKAANVLGVMGAKPAATEAPAAVMVEFVLELPGVLVVQWEARESWRALLGGGGGGVVGWWSSRKTGSVTGVGRGAKRLWREGPPGTLAGGAGAGGMGGTSSLLVGMKRRKIDASRCQYLAMVDTGS